MNKIPPSGFFFIYFISGIFLQRISGSLFYIFLFFILSLFFIKEKYFFLIPLFLLFLLLGFSLSKTSFPEFENFQTLNISKIRGYIEEIEEKEKVKEVVFKPNSKKERILLIFSKSSSIELGDEILIENLDIFPLERRDIFNLWSKGITLQGKIKSYQIIGSKRLTFFSSLRNKVKEYIGRLFSKNSNEVSSFLKAIILGETGNLPKELRDIFINTGTAHLLAISGLHITLLISFLTYFFSSKRLKLILSIFLFIYALIVDKPPVFRAVGMYFFLILAKNLVREEDILNSFFLVALISLISSPFNLFNISFQLSYLATFALIISPFTKISFFPSYLQNIWKTSTFLFLFLLPFNIYFFQRITLLSLISNFFSIPIFHVILFLSFLAIFLSFFPITFLLNIVEILSKFLFLGLQWMMLNYKISLILSLIIFILPLLLREAKKDELLGV